ncbi:MAG: hypothetical protein HPY45_17475 [Anaerolineae bacterium]|nr:hypothetical protein [Anaerolineae bacterium]
MHNRGLLLILTCGVLSLACTWSGWAGQTAAPTTAPVETAVSAPPATSAPPVVKPPAASPCGNGTCEGPENPKNCPADCPPQNAAPSEAPPNAPSAAPPANRPAKTPQGAPGAQGELRLETHEVINPASGAKLFATAVYPASWDGQSRLPALVLVPGGSGSGQSFLREDASHPATAARPTTASLLTEAGFAVIVFDPDGRGRSGGKEDNNGFIQQDGLAAVIRAAAGWQGIDPARMALVTYSYGITMGSGALARYPDLPIRFLIDWEGPANRDDTGGCDASHLGHLSDVASCTDEAFWAQREASTFIGQIRIPYQRVQSEKDHVQPDQAHTVLMINNAINGGVPWVRLNSEPPNQTYTLATLPALLPESMDPSRDQIIADFASQLMAQ